MLHGSTGRFTSLSGNDRYLYWRAAVQGLRGHWVGGSGPGTYIDVWQPRASVPDQIRNAHSLYVETLSDTGVVGLVLLAGFFLAVLAATFAARRPDRGPAMDTWPRHRDEETAELADITRRTAAAAVLAAVLAFIISAALDWVWQVPVLPVALMLLAAAVLTPETGVASVRPRGAVRAVLTVLAVAALIIIAVPLAATSAVRESQGAVARGELAGALADARTAIRVEPGAGTPHLQAALVLELGRRLTAAVTEARAAVQADPHNAEDWLVLSRLDAEDGRAGAAVLAFRRARALNPTSTLTRL